MGARFYRRRYQGGVPRRPDLERRGIYAVRVGWSGKEALKAYVNEYGTRHIPARPFIRSFGRRFPDVVRPILESEIDSLRGGYDYAAGKEMGDAARALMRRIILAWTHPPNAPSTVRRKGRNDPLVDTGKMANTVRVWIETRQDRGGSAPDGSGRVRRGARIQIEV